MAVTLDRILSLKEQIPGLTDNEAAAYLSVGAYSAHSQSLSLDGIEAKGTDAQGARIAQTDHFISALSKIHKAGVEIESVEN